MNIDGLIIGGATFLIIGILHPAVIKGEYYFGVKIWPLFLIAALGCMAASVFIDHFVVSTILGVLGFSLAWGIHELFDQKKRVEKGWFPANPKRANKK